MEKTLSSSNVNSVVLRLSGFVGETPISASHAIKSNVRETMCLSIQRTSCLSALGLGNVPSVATTMGTANRKC